MKCLKGNDLHEIVQRAEDCIFDDNFDNIVVNLALKLNSKKVENHVQQQIGDKLEILLDNTNIEANKPRNDIESVEGKSLTMMSLN